jgi:hypothetical protein
MKSKRTTAVTEKESPEHIGTGSMFDKSNLMWMLIGAAVMILGFILMAGGRSEDPKVFNPDEVYSTTRITIAPILILAGLGIEIFALFREPKKNG